MSLLLVAGLAGSTTATTVSKAVSTAKPVSVTSLFFQLVIGLAVVLGLIWVASKVARGRIGMTPGKRRGGPLSVVSRQPLGKGVQIAVVRAGAETYLLGVTAHQVTRLARFRPDSTETPDDQSSDDLPAAERAHAAGAPPAFRLQSTIRQLQERTLRRG